SFLIFLAVVGWVVYTMGGDKFGDWSSLRYSTLSCLLGTATACVVVSIVTLTGYISVPTMETVKTVSPHILFMIVFPGLIALLGWNVGVRILSPLNGLLFINFVPVTTLVVSMFQGYVITSFDLVGTALIIASLLANYFYTRMASRKLQDQHAEKSTTRLLDASCKY